MNLLTTNYLPLSYSPTELIPHEIGWGSYFLEGRMHGKPSVIGRTVSPLATRMPREADRFQFLTWAGRTSFHSHIVIFSTLMQVESWPLRIHVLQSPFPIFVYVSEFLHTGRGLDIHLT